jgi:hypothetical protein
LYVPGSEATFFVRISNAGGCRVYSDSISFKPDTVTHTGVYDFHGEWIELFPNPVNDRLQLKVKVLNSEINEFVMTIYDVVGRCVYQARNAAEKQEGTYSIPFESYCEGMYFVHIRSTKGTYCKKFIKE